MTKRPIDNEQLADDAVMLQESAVQDESAKQESAVQDKSAKQESAAQDESPSPKKKPRGKRVAGIVIGVIAAIAIIFVAIVLIGKSSLLSPIAHYDEGRTIEYQSETYELNENIVTVLVMGYDTTDLSNSLGLAGQADAIMALAIDTKSGKITAIVIPRDSMVEVGEFVGEAFIGIDEMQICLAFGYGDGAHKSCEYTVTVASRVLLNMPISYYFALSMDGIGPLTDAIGGVTVTPVTTLSWANIYAGQTITLHGDRAETYVRTRDSYAVSASLERQQRQEQFVRAYAQQALTAAKSNPAILTDLFKQARTYAYTNLGIPEFSFLAMTAVTSGITEINIVSLKGTMGHGSYSEYYLDDDYTMQTVVNTFYTKVEKAEASDASASK